MGQPQNYNPREIIYRVGTFFLLVGLGLFIFFMLSEGAQNPQFNYFCWSLVLLIIGFIFRAQYRKQTASSGRFNTIRRIFSRHGGDEQDE